MNTLAALQSSWNTIASLIIMEFVAAAAAAAADDDDDERGSN